MQGWWAAKLHSAAAKSQSKSNCNFDSNCNPNNSAKFNSNNSKLNSNSELPIVILMRPFGPFGPQEKASRGRQRKETSKKARLPQDKRTKLAAHRAGRK